MGAIVNLDRQKTAQRSRHRGEGGEQERLVHGAILLQSATPLSKSEGEGLSSSVLEGKEQRSIAHRGAAIEDVVQTI